MAVMRATGKVTRIYPRPEVTNVRLEIPADLQPLENYFSIELTHPNHDVLCSLALSAAINGYQLTIRTRAAITPDAPALVEYMFVDW